jgi:hypothetical protein
MGAACASAIPLSARRSSACWRTAVSSRVRISVMRAQRMRMFCMKMFS